mmetsp:Transcript_15616/g.61031  ORF Transcript_15616/g.61031 Transcript_15616/m.61031 type:complete len:417 (-) Transcript_15616:150-1400(-)
MLLSAPAARGEGPRAQGAAARARGAAGAEPAPSPREAAVILVRRGPPGEPHEQELRSWPDGEPLHLYDVRKREPQAVHGEDRLHEGARQPAQDTVFADYRRGEEGRNQLAGGVGAEAAVQRFHAQDGGGEALARHHRVGAASHGRLRGRPAHGLPATRQDRQPDAAGVHDQGRPQHCSRGAGQEEAGPPGRLQPGSGPGPAAGAQGGRGVGAEARRADPHGADEEDHAGGGAAPPRREPRHGHHDEPWLGADDVTRHVRHGHRPGELLLAQHRAQRAGRPAEQHLHTADQDRKPARQGVHLEDRPLGDRAPQDRPRALHFPATVVLVFPAGPAPPAQATQHSYPRAGTHGSGAALAARGGLTPHLSFLLSAGRHLYKGSFHAFLPTPRMRWRGLPPCQPPTASAPLHLRRCPRRVP